MKVILFLMNYHPILTEVWVKLLKMKLEKKRRKGKGRNESLHDDVLEQEFNALVAKQENLALKKRKLEIELYLLEQEVLHGDTTVLTE